MIEMRVNMFPLTCLGLQPVRSTAGEEPEPQDDLEREWSYIHTNNTTSTTRSVSILTSRHEHNACEIVTVVHFRRRDPHLRHRGSALRDRGRAEQRWMWQRLPGMLLLSVSGWAECPWARQRVGLHRRPLGGGPHGDVYGRERRQPAERHDHKAAAGVGWATASLFSLELPRLQLDDSLLVSRDSWICLADLSRTRQRLHRWPRSDAPVCEPHLQLPRLLSAILHLLLEDGWRPVVEWSGERYFYHPSGDGRLQTPALQSHQRRVGAVRLRHSEHSRDM